MNARKLILGSFLIPAVALFTDGITSSFATGGPGPVEPPVEPPIDFTDVFPIPPIIEDIYLPPPGELRPEPISDIAFFCPFQENFDPRFPTTNPVSEQPIVITFNVETAEAQESRQLSIRVADLNTIILRTFNHNGDPLSALTLNLGQNVNQQITPGEQLPLIDEQLDFVQLLKRPLVLTQLSSCLSLIAGDLLFQLRQQNNQVVNLEEGGNPHAQLANELDLGVRPERGGGFGDLITLDEVTDFWKETLNDFVEDINLRELTAACIKICKFGNGVLQGLNAYATAAACAAAPPSCPAVMGISGGNATLIQSNSDQCANNC